MFGMMPRLSQDCGDPDAGAAFKTMSVNPDAANGQPHAPPELFVMELFRTVAPNARSVSSIADMRAAGS